jgi:curli biogenesis system outer membrane secretion channel CsgG
MMMTLSTAAMGYQQQMQTAAERIGESMTKTGKRTVAVVDFTDLQGNATELGRFFAEQLSVELSTSGGTYEVIDRNHLRAILQEHKLSGTGLIDPQTARKVGQMAGAECLVSGSITPFSESVNLSIKLLDTNTAKILGGVTVDIPRTSTINELLARGIGTQLITGTTSSTSKPTTASAGPTKGSPVTEESNGVEVSIKECKRSGRAVTCQGTLKNVTDAQLHVNFVAFGGAEIVDNLANRSKGRAVFTSGGGDWELDIEPDLPVKFWIDKAEVAPDATSLTARITMGVRGGYGRGASSREVVVLRNIPLQ